MFLLQLHWWRGRLVGLVRTLGKRVGPQGPRGFESLPLRQPSLCEGRYLYGDGVAQGKEDIIHLMVSTVTTHLVPKVFANPIIIGAEPITSGVDILMPFQFLFSIDYLIILLLGILGELCVTFLFGFKQKKQLATVALVNLVTQPAINYVLLLLESRNGDVTFNQVIFFEAVIILIEAGFLLLFLKRAPQKILILALVMNVVSFIIGRLLLYS